MTHQADSSLCDLCLSLACALLVSFLDSLLHASRSTCSVFVFSCCLPDALTITCLFLLDPQPITPPPATCTTCIHCLRPSLVAVSSKKLSGAHIGTSLLALKASYVVSMPELHWNYLHPLPVRAVGSASWYTQGLAHGRENLV